MAGPEFAPLEHDQPQAQLAEPAAPTVLHRSSSPILVVGHAEDRAEYEADQAADSVLARLNESEPGRHQGGPGPVQRMSGPSSSSVVGRAGGALDDDLSARIEQARGSGSALADPVRARMEAGFRRSLSDIRVHTGPEAAALSRSISARAFTTGRDIFFGSGEYAPHTPDGERVLAHELAHTTQSSGIQRELIHRKLRGTAEALENLGGGRTSSKVQKAFSSLTNWDEILSGVRKYEGTEATLLAGGANPTPTDLRKAKPKLLSTLRNVERSIGSWRGKNNEDDAKALVDEWHQTATVGKPGKPNSKTGKQKMVTSKQATDDRAKAGRRQAIAMLEPRLANETMLLNNQDPDAWPSSLGLSPDKVAVAGQTDSGQKNTVQELDYQTEAGDFKGYFKEEKGFNTEPEPQELAVGIKQADPNYGARSVALYRLDQLLNAGVTARAEFAVHKDANGNSVLGTVLESAKGKQAAKTKFGQSTGHAKAIGGGAIGLDDPALQRGLNKLQILDAIAGQLDRHEGNYYIQSDGKGGAAKVTGIDLDMAFGADMTSIDDKTITQSAQNFKGMPEAIDAEMGRAILAIRAQDIRDVLTGLLGKAEVDATVSRFLEVQARVQDADDKGLLREQWGAKSAAERPDATTIAFGDDRKTYADHAAFGSLLSLGPEIAAIGAKVLLGEAHNPRYLADARIHSLHDEHPPVQDAYRQVLTDFNGGGLFEKALPAYMFDNHMDHSEFEPLVMLMCDALLEQGVIDQVVLIVMEEAGMAGVKSVMSLLDKEFKTQLPVAAQRLASLNKSQRRRQAFGRK